MSLGVSIVRDTISSTGEGVMSSKKSAKKTGNARTNGNGAGRTRGAGPKLELSFDEYTRPARLNPESPEEREKRLAARKALTLRAFRMTYENHRRKASR
jgi:hypothetical protein